MHFSIEEVSPVEKKLAVEVEWPLVAAKLDAAYKELSRDVAIRGFRKGKVPRNILERMFARRVEDQVTQQLIQESFVRAVQQHALQPVVEPIVDEIALVKGTPFRYQARIEVRATFDPRDYDGIPLERKPPEVTAADVEQALERKRQELAEYKPIAERDALTTKDVVLCELRGEVAGKPLQRDNVLVDLSEPARDPLPGLGAALLGQSPKPASPLEISLDLGPGEDDGPPRQAKLSVTIRDARERLVPTLDDDFAKDTGEADTLDELRGKLREQLLSEKEREQRNELRKQLIRELLRHNEFQVPPSLVERQSEVMVQRAKLSIAMQGVDVRNVGLNESRMKDELRPAASDEVRTTFLLDAIATKENVQVSEAELEKHLAQTAEQRNTSVPRLKAELQKEGRFEYIKHQLREEKTLDLLLSRANITETAAASTPSEK